MVQARNVLKRLNMERLFAEIEERALTKGKSAGENCRKSCFLKHTVVLQMIVP